MIVVGIKGLTTEPRGSYCTVSRKTNRRGAGHDLGSLALLGSMKGQKRDGKC